MIIVINSSSSCDLLEAGKYKKNGQVKFVFKMVFRILIDPTFVEWITLQFYRAKQLC